MMYFLSRQKSTWNKDTIEGTSQSHSRTRSSADSWQRGQSKGPWHETKVPGQQVSLT